MLSTIIQALSLLDRKLKKSWLTLIPLAVTAAVLEVIAVISVFYLIRTITLPDQSQITLPFDFFPSTDRQSGSIVVTLCILIGVIYLVKNSLRLYESFLRERCTQQSALTMASQLLAHYLNGPYSLHYTRNSSELIRNIQNSTNAISRNVLASATAMCTEILVCMGVLAVLLYSEPMVTLLAGVSIAAMMGIILIMTQKYHSLWGKQTHEYGKTLLQTLRQSLRGIKEIKILKREEFFIQRYIKQQSQLDRVTTRRGVLSVLPRLTVETVFILGVMTIIISHELWFSNRYELIPLLGLFTYAGFRLLPSFHIIVYHWNNIKFGSAALENIQPDWDQLQQSTGSKLPINQHRIELSQGLEFQHVCFSYPEGNRQALRDINVSIKKGETIGIVGPTGAGKSTFIDLLLGLVNPSSGQICIDGKPLNPELWQKLIGYVPQSVYLLDESIARNVALGEKQIDELKLHRALESAQLLEFISQLPQGVDTPVGEQGIRLSGGQRQRIAIARALYHDPQILIFDEATASLDYKTEQSLIDAVDALHGEKTIIMVAHRLRTVRHTDRVLFFSEGKLRDTGGFEELNQRNEQFRRIAELE